jgi:beta-glucosidase
VWDAAAEANYRAQLLALRARGITPLVTIHHYTFPLWVSQKGGFEWNDPGRNVADAMAAYAGRLGEKFGDLVDFWCTINEPNYGTFESYLFGGYPPGAQDMVRLGAAYSMTMKAHARMAAALRAKDTVDADGDGHATRIGVALNVNIFEPTSTNPLDVAMAGLVDDAYNEMVPRAAATGRIKLAFPGTLDIDEEVPGLKGSFDYLGLNYYSRFYVRFDLTDGSFSRQYYMPGRDQSDIGFENYAEGFYRLLMRMNRWGWPLYVLENGVADTSGTRRPQYLRNHLYALIQARAQGADVRGYFQWSLVDVFEWTFGYGGKLGLFRVDQSDPTLTRQRTPAVDTFRQIAEEGGLVPAP